MDCGEITLREIRLFQVSDLSDQVASAFRESKPDSFVCRIPKKLVCHYFKAVIERGGRILVAYSGLEAIGFLVFVSDNNVSLSFLRRHKFAIGLGLLLSLRWSDKKLLMDAVSSSLRMRGRVLPPEFQNEISLLAISPQCTGHGVGTSLVRMLFETQRGEIRVKTDLANTGAIRFYRRAGFVETGLILGIKATPMIGFRRVAD